LEVKEEYQVKISSRFSTLVKFDDDEDEDDDDDNDDGKILQGV
jgi:hypothetical protein